MKILLATDFSEPSRAALESTRESPWPIGTQIRIVHAIDLSPFIPELVALDEMKALQQKCSKFPRMNCVDPVCASQRT
jgi:hypothetical protein